MNSLDAFLPRLALLIADAEISAELEKLLRSKYSSLLLIANRKQLSDFPIPLVIMVDTVSDIAEIRKLHTAEGTRILVIGKADSEVLSAAVGLGADDYVTYPFTESELLEKTEKYLEAFRNVAAA